jgi:hypothetical protein
MSGRDTILFLDDSPERAALAYQRMISIERDSTIWCRTAKEAIDVLKDYWERLSKVYLDHDLGGEQEDVPMHSGNEQSGMEVVRYLEDMDPDKFKGCSFIVHSFNSHAGLKMVERLIYAGYKATYKPFGTDKL